MKRNISVLCQKNHSNLRNGVGDCGRAVFVKHPTSKTIKITAICIPSDDGKAIYDGGGIHVGSDDHVEAVVHFVRRILIDVAT